MKREASKKFATIRKFKVASYTTLDSIITLLGPDTLHGSIKDKQLRGM